MAIPAISQLETVGDFSLVWTHPLINAGASVSLVGFKIEASIIRGKQIMANAKLVPLIGQITVIITNTVRAGTLTLTAVRTTGNTLLGDIVAICQYLQTVGDNVGGQLRASWSQNGALQAVTFTNVTVANCDPIHIMGNDVGEYDVQLVYGNWTIN